MFNDFYRFAFCVFVFLAVESNTYTDTFVCIYCRQTHCRFLRSCTSKMAQKMAIWPTALIQTKVDQQLFGGLS